MTTGSSEVTDYSEGGIYNFILLDTDSSVVSLWSAVGGDLPAKMSGDPQQ